MHDIIYILINEAMPGYVKIGKTDKLEQRIRDLDNTSVPLPFECFYACTVQDAAFVEKQLHDAFSDHRIRSTREFFAVSPERIMAALKLAEIQNVTPGQDAVDSAEDQRALNQARIRRSVFNFKMVDIPLGSELVYLNDENFKATVLDNRQINFNGEVTSLSASAQKLLGYAHGVAGTEYWMYEGETLNERRRRLEAEG